MPFGIGPLELILVLLIALVIFGPKRLPGLGRSLGQGMREFKDSVTGKDRADEEDEKPRQLPSAERDQAGPASPLAGSEQGSEAERAASPPRP